MNAMMKPGETETGPGAAAGGALAPRGAAVSRITPAQRAAVIIAMLGEGAAKPIVEKLDDAALAKVVAALESISYLPREDLVEIVVDFLTNLRKSTGALRGGRSKAREVLASLVDAQRLDTLIGEAPGGSKPADAAPGAGGGDVWARLAEREPAAIAAYLNGLTPNIIALILRRLEPAMASDILCHVEDDKLAPVMGYLVEAEQPDPGINSVIARMVEMEFLNAVQDSAEGTETHLEAIGELLSLIPDDKRDSLVAFLKSEHEAKLKAIEKSMLTLEGLPGILPRAAVPVVFRELEQPVLVKVLASLQATHGPVAEFLLDNISSRMADQFRDELEGLQALSAAESEQVQRDFLSALMRFKQRGLITFERAEDDAAEGGA